MSYSSDSSSRTAIQAIQFELWPDCNNGCTYCYLKGTQRVTTHLFKVNSILKTQDVLNDLEIYNTYNAIGLIGGEFFDKQLNGIESEWFTLITLIKTRLQQSYIKEVWLATALLFEDLTTLDKTLQILESGLLDNQVIRVCTSYDTIGRFLTEKKHLIWIKNMEWIAKTHPKIHLHIQTILTQDTIEKVILNPDYFDIITKNASIDFRYPSISRKDCPTATGIKDYRGMMLNRLSQFPEKFFLEDRNTFLKFLKVFYRKYGLQKIQNLIHQPEMRSRNLTIYVENTEIKDRWNDTRDVYLPCGHLVDGLCYVNDNNHCIYCDIEKFIRNLENTDVIW